MKPKFSSVLIFLFLFAPLSSKGQESELRKIKTPIWSKDAIQPPQRAVLEFQTTISPRPPFYKGSMPLKFKGGEEVYASNMMAALYCDFEGFRNTFIYLDVIMRFSGIAEGARTTDSSGRLLAEARLTRRPFSAEWGPVPKRTEPSISDKKKQVKEIEIEEFHYDKNGKLIFKCISQIDFATGVKQKEYKAIGKKQSDYYFVWPVGKF